MGDTQKSQTISTQSQGIATQVAHNWTGCSEERAQDKAPLLVGESSLVRIKMLAEANPSLVFTSLAHRIDVSLLRKSFRQLPKNESTGVDKITAKQYAKDLKNFGKAQLICSQFKTKSNNGKRKHLACNDLKATPRQIVIGYRLRWAIEIFHKEIKMFLDFEDVSAKYFSSVISHVHWVYCAYILLNWSPPGFANGVKSMAEKQLTVNKIIENKGLSAVNQLLTQAKGTQRLKAHIQKTLKDLSSSKRTVLWGLPGF